MTDESIKTNVVDQLRWDARVDASDINVAVDNGAVTLSGSVPTMRTRRAARDAAITVAGVTSVINNITVTYPATTTVPSDSEIKDNVMSYLESDPDIDASDISVEVDGGVVKLSGNVPSYWQKVLAEDSAFTIPGVISTTNELAVVPTLSKTDAEIAEDITQAIERNMTVSVEEVDVEVEDGMVTLSGSVDTWSDWSAVYDTARFTPGVIGVNDEIAIREFQTA